MQKVSSRREPFGWVVRASLGPLAVALLLGCASGAKTAPSPEGESTAAVATAEPAAPAQITSLQIREAAPGVRLELQATAPLVWTQYRDSEGRLVLELPNSTPGRRRRRPRAGGRRGAVAVTVRQVDSGERPLTRLVIATQVDTEHDLAANGNTLQLTLVPAGSDETMAVASEPVPRRPSPSRHRRPLRCVTKARRRPPPLRRRRRGRWRPPPRLRPRRPSPARRKRRTSHPPRRA